MKLAPTPVTRDSDRFPGGGRGRRRGLARAGRQVISQAVPARASSAESEVNSPNKSIAFSISNKPAARPAPVRHPPPVSTENVLIEEAGTLGIRLLEDLTVESVNKDGLLDAASKGSIAPGMVLMRVAGREVDQLRDFHYMVATEKRPLELVFGVPQGTVAGEPEPEPEDAEPRAALGP